MLTSEENVLRRCKESFEELMKNECQERRLNDVQTANHVVQWISTSEDEVRTAMKKKMKSRKAVGPYDIPADAGCLEETACGAF